MKQEVKRHDHGYKTTKGRGPAAQTVSGKLIFLLDPDPDQISIYDIAHGLSMQCRYNGQIPEFYSVAQHSVIVAEYFESQGCDKLTCLKALLHDAHEAYIGDIITPLKVLIPDYQKIEDHLDDIICDKFGIPRGMTDELIQADKTILATEIRDLRPHKHIGYPGSPKLNKPLKNVEITPVGQTEAFKMFLQKFLEYTE